MTSSLSRSTTSAVSTALEGAWAPVRQRLLGLTRDEYLWEPTPESWTIRRRGTDWIADWEDPDPEPAPVTTIAWRCWHIAVDCLDSYSQRLFSQTGSSLTARHWVPDPAAAMMEMDRSWHVFRDGVERWDDLALLDALYQAQHPEPRPGA